MEFQFNDGGREAAGMKMTKGRGDCVTRAIAIATGKPYLDVWNDLKALGEKERLSKHRKFKSHPDKGVWKPTIRRYMESLGWAWTPTMAVGAGTTVHLKKDELPSGRLVVGVSKHSLAVIDGVVHDTYEDHRDGTRCVYGYFTGPYLGAESASEVTQSTEESSMAHWYDDVDEDIAEDFDNEEWSAERDRKALAKLVRNAASSIASGKSHAGRNGLWRRGAKHNELAFKLAYKGHDIQIVTPNGPRSEIHFRSTESAERALKGLADEIENTDIYDSELAAITGSEKPSARRGSAKAKPSGTRTAKTGADRASSLPPRKDGLGHHIDASEPQPHPDYQLNRAKSHWRSPEQVAADKDRSARRLAAMAKK